MNTYAGGRFESIAESHVQGSPVKHTHYKHIMLKANVLDISQPLG